MKELIDPKVIPKEIIGRVTKPLTVTSSNGRPAAPEEGIMTYGLGMFVYSYRGHTMWQHSGGLPGTCSYMVILPDRNIGVMIMTNDDDWGAPLCKAIPYTIVDKLLAVEPADWQTRCVDDTMKFLAPKDPASTPPESPRPPLDASVVAGKYSNNAFGQFNIRPLNEVPEVVALLPMLKKKSYTPLPHTDQMYVTKFDNIFTDFILFFPVDGPRYGYMTFSQINAQPSPKSSEDQPSEDGDISKGKVIWAWGKGISVFNEQGVGMFGGFNRPGDIEDMPKVTEEDVDRKADVWFARD